MSQNGKRGIVGTQGSVTTDSKGLLVCGHSKQIRYEQEIPAKKVKGYLRN